MRNEMKIMVKKIKSMLVLMLSGIFVNSCDEVQEVPRFFNDFNTVDLYINSSLNNSGISGYSRKLVNGSQLELFTDDMTITIVYDNSVNGIIDFNSELFSVSVNSDVYGKFRSEVDDFSGNIQFNEVNFGGDIMLSADFSLNSDADSIHLKFDTLNLVANTPRVFAHDYLFKTKVLEQGTDSIVVFYISENKDTYENQDLKLIAVNGGGTELELTVSDFPEISSIGENQISASNSVRLTTANGTYKRAYPESVRLVIEKIETNEYWDVYTGYFYGELKMPLPPYNEMNVVLPFVKVMYKV